MRQEVNQKCRFKNNAFIFFILQKIRGKCSFAPPQNAPMHRPYMPYMVMHYHALLVALLELNN